MTKKPLLSAAILAVVAIIIAVGYYSWQKKQHLSSPNYAVSQLEKAIHFQDINLFNKHTQMRQLSQSLLTHIITPDNTAPTETGLIGTFKKLGSDLSHKFTDYIKPELEKNIQEQLAMFVSEGSFTRKMSVSSLYSPDQPLLEKVWRNFAGTGVIYNGIDAVIPLADRSAKVDLAFTRADLDYTFTVRLAFTRDSQNVWQVVGVDNLSDVLHEIETRSSALRAKQNAETAAQIAKHLRPYRASKSSGKSEWGIGQGIMLSIAFENIGEMDITFFEAKVTFKDTDGTILRTVTIKDTDTITAGQISEKSWPMAINPLSESDLYIHRATPDELVIETYTTMLVLANGKTLSIQPNP